jgi:isopropanol dehydrogenase (NADP+)
VTRAGGRVSNIGYHGENPAPPQLPLDAFGDVERAFEMMTTKEDGIIKPLITFGGSAVPPGRQTGHKAGIR